MFNFWQVIGLISFVAFLIFFGVFLGGLLVFKTKRESHETLIGGTPKGDCFSIDSSEEEDDNDLSPTKIPEEISEMNARFLDQFGGSA